MLRQVFTNTTTAFLNRLIVTGNSCQSALLLTTPKRCTFLLLIYL